ncbi:hypothetical protein F5878DRAFT_509330, partial [Lentinula raphanica]
PTSRFRTGTNFTWQQLTVKWEGPHRYRHDLESVFYVILLFAFLHLNPSTKEPEPYDEYYSYHECHQQDDRFFVFLLGHSEWSPPPIQAFFSGFDLWLQRLRFCLFRGISTKNLRLAYQHRLTDKSEDDTDQDEIWPELKLKEDFDEDTLGGWVSYDKLFLIMHRFEGEQLET